MIISSLNILADAKSLGSTPVTEMNEDEISAALKLIRHEIRNLEADEAPRTDSGRGLIDLRLREHKLTAQLKALEKKTEGASLGEELEIRHQLEIIKFLQLHSPKQFTSKEIKYQVAPELDSEKIGLFLESLVSREIISKKEVGKGSTLREYYRIPKVERGRKTLTDNEKENVFIFLQKHPGTFFDIYSLLSLALPHLGFNWDIHQGLEYYLRIDKSE